MHGLQRRDFVLYIFIEGRNLILSLGTTESNTSSIVKIARICVLQYKFMGKLATIKYSLLLQTKPLKNLAPVNMRFLGAKVIDVLLCVHTLQNTDKKIVD
jgi:hypothetical protein